MHGGGCMDGGGRKLVYGGGGVDSGGGMDGGGGDDLQGYKFMRRQQDKNVYKTWNSTGTRR